MFLLGALSIIAATTGGGIALLATLGDDKKDKKKDSSYVDDFEPYATSSQEYSVYL